MFGNIKPLKSEMKIKEYTNYRAYYCGLCKSMGSRYQGLCNMGLSYEAVFIAIMISAMSDEAVMVKPKACYMHPLSKHPMVVHNASVDTAAAVNVLLMYNSFCDNVNDENDFKSKLAKLWFKKPYKKAVGDMPSINDIIRDKLEDLSLIEESSCDVLDMAAEPFSVMMGQLAENIIQHDNEDIYWFGFFMGKWLYVIDAYQDIEQDIKNKSYNPFVKIAESASEEITADNVRRITKDDAEFVLSGALVELSRIFDRLNIKRNADIIENILFKGMPARTEDVISGRKPVKNRDEYPMA